MKKLLFLGVVFFASYLTANSQSNNPGSNHANRFEELKYLLAMNTELPAEHRDQNTGNNVQITIFLLSWMNQTML